MKIRPYRDSDWDAVCEIYDRSKPDEMRGGVDVNAIIPLEQDPSHLALFRESVILVATDAGRVMGFGGYKGNYIAWLFVHPTDRRKGVARALLKEMMGRLQGNITLNVGPWNHAARTLYADCGFVILREFTGTFNGHDINILTLSYDQAG